MKFQTYENFGIAGYESKVAPFIKGKKEDGANGFNRLDQVPIDELLQYCGEDSIYTYKLFENQKWEIENRYPEAFDLFMKAVQNFGEMERVGFKVLSGYYKEKRDLIRSRCDAEMVEILLGNPSISQSFNPGSPQQVAKLIYDQMGLSNDEGNRSTNAETLEKMRNKTCNSILSWRRLSWLSGTTLNGFVRETSEDGNLHTFFNLNVAATYRSSSSSPNFQNIPVRDPEIKKLARSGLFPRLGQSLMELDFKAIEVCVSACVHRDPEMIK